MPVSNTNVPVTLFDGGIKQDKSSIAIPPSNMPNCRNIVIKDGVAEEKSFLVMIFSNVPIATDGRKMHMHDLFFRRHFLTRIKLG